MNDREEARRPPADLAEARAWLDALEQLSTAEERESKRLRDRLELFRQFVENSQGLVCSHDLRGTLLYVSPASAMELGYAPGEGVGRNLREFLAPSVRPFFDTYLERIREKEADRGLLRLVSRSGEERLWAYRNVLYRPPDGEPYVIGHAVAITERDHLGLESERRAHSGLCPRERGCRRRQGRRLAVPARGAARRARPSHGAA